MAAKKMIFLRTSMIYRKKVFSALAAFISRNILSFAPCGSKVSLGKIAYYSYRFTSSAIK
jgi:hypothetical protein